MEIEINGVIGWEVTSSQIKEKLKQANGKDIKINIHSPGGSVFEGLSIYNAIKNYKGNVEIIVNGLAASMASIIALSRGKFKAFKSSAFMIHNASNFAMGDYREMYTNGKFLEGATNMLAKTYEEVTGKSLNDVRELMDNETWYWGAEDMKKNGFVSEIIEDEDKKEEDVKVMAQLEMEDCTNKMSKYKVDASLRNEMIAMFDVSAKIPVEKNAGENIKKGDVKMNFEELKANHPDLFNKVFQAGMEKERERVSAHLKLANTYSASMEIVSKFVSEGKSISDDTVLAEYLTAKAVKEKTEARVADNPEASTDASGKNAFDDSDEFEKALKSELGVK